MTIRLASLWGQDVASLAQGGPESAGALTPREVLFVEGIARGESLADSATAAGVSYRTARRWRLKPHVAEAIRNRVGENLSQTRAILSAGSSRAARSLVSMSDGTTPAESARVSAARAVVESATKLAEIEELASRLAEIEAQLAQGEI
jgi:HD-like signal output (HDOD) protein